MDAQILREELEKQLQELQQQVSSLVTGECKRFVQETAWPRVFAATSAFKKQRAWRAIMHARVGVLRNVTCLHLFRVTYIEHYGDNADNAGGKRKIEPVVRLGWFAPARP